MAAEKQQIWDLTSSHHTLCMKFYHLRQVEATVWQANLPRLWGASKLQTVTLLRELSFIRHVGQKILCGLKKSHNFLLQYTCKFFLDRNLKEQCCLLIRRPSYIEHCHFTIATPHLQASGYVQEKTTVVILTFLQIPTPCYFSVA